MIALVPLAVSAAEADPLADLTLLLLRSGDPVVKSLLVLAVAALGATLVIRLTTDLAIPGWATTVFGVLLIILLQATMFLFVFSFMILAGRNGASFLPRRDYVHFVGPKQEVYRR